jgi:hypothetical protein
MNLFISFSGGETSAFMAQWLMTHKAKDYDKVVCVFANTGQENEETLQFVDKCDNAFSLGVVWIEAEINQEDKSKSSIRLVDFETADRSGRVFEDVIKQYGIPNPDWLHCTRELKTRPMTKYMRSIGWGPGSYHTAIGIRSDEIDRMDANASEKGLIYPLVSTIEMTKPRINRFWAAQPFRLNLKGYQGNCKWCWKKSLRKHMTLINENPNQYDFPERMEKLYSGVNPEGDHNDRVFFRSNKSTQDIRRLASGGGFTPASDDAIVYDDQLGLDLDLSYGCSDSCEIEY